ncbi:hypothetical protein [Bailinhaonella thermotolerans]|uniref:Uncharacterized protein n=1 Tax=Bailinhaonella thermotolerans TaxID=1070861 RepID=A0A3A4AWI4_9ACTN|nr:hypothetical protein [Bailinhaonella thermotolerans]RJL34285.1 hypothetical protein D5H75_07455 [Bailinhaonella thermotolerans]
MVPAVEAAEALRGELSGRHGVSCDLSVEWCGCVLLRVYADLVVYCDGRVFRWWAGRLSQGGRPVWAFAHVREVPAAARRIARRRAWLRRTHPLAPALEKEDFDAALARPV